MKTFTRLGLRAALAATTTLAGAAVLIAPAHAQTSTATIRGTVRDAAGAPTGATVVTATSTATGIAYTATSGADGSYVLNGVRPGVYTITVDAADGTRFEQTVSVGVGQAATLDIALTAAESGDASTITPGTAADSGEGDIIVTGNTLRETRTSEVATNVSQAQIRRLPQTDRNFLSFAALAPGVRYNDSETDKGFSSGAQTASQVNVFIDGVSLKNKLREGGVAGQQNSRGNPFGQLAVQEFRVATQNYKAEYEQAGSAVITAITKSGTNEFHGEAFGQYTDKGLTQKAFLDRVNNRVEPAFERKQYGVALGGPIIKDKLFFFGTYEGNDQDRAFTVQSNATAAQRDLFRAQTGRNVSDFEGNFVSPFRGDFYFGKLTLAPNSTDVFDLSFSRREETDIQGFGGETSFEAAENKRNKVDTYLYKWTHTGEGFVNEFNANYLNYTFNPSSLNPNLPQFQYIGIITFGGKDSTRRETQTGYTIRDDLTWTGWQGHVVKVGARVEVTDIEFNNQSFIQPRFTYGINGTGTPNDATDDTDFTFPFEARLGLGNGRILASNTQFGAYVQDDWDITETLQLNLGVRWDYETNGFNNSYVTPSNAAAALRAYPSTYYFDPNNYISNGRNRTPFLYAFAPRFGFSWDINDDQSTVFFGGAGRYYDRNNFNNTVDELSRRINPVGVFRFSRTGAPRNGLPTVAFNNSYLTADGLRVLAATSEQGLPELFAVKNDAKPPVNDQFSLGVRQKVGVFQASLTASYQRGRNGYTNLFATRNNNGLGNCCNTAAAVRNGYSNILIGFDGLDTRYKALFFTLDKNYTEASGWGMNLAYTFGKAEKNGGDLFSLDGLTPDQYGWRTSPGDERHRVVLSGLVDLPLGIQFSTLTTLGSGQAYQVTDATRGFDTGQLRFTSAYPIKNCIRGVFAFCQVDLTLAKRFSIFNSNDGLELAVDVLNAFNNKNFSGFDGFFSATDPLVRTEIGTSTLTLPRRFQFRAGFRF